MWVKLDPHIIFLDGNSLLKESLSNIRDLYFEIWYDHV